MRKHGPQPLLKGFRIHVFLHFVLADHQFTGNGFAQVCSFKLFTGDACQHHAMGPWKGKFALVGAAGLYQLRILLQCVDDLDGTVAGLLQRACDHFGLPICQDFKAFSRGAAYGVQPPIFGLQNQGAPVRM